MFQERSSCPSPRANRVIHFRLSSIAALALASTFATSRVGAQAAVDPNVAPRAAALERAGERRMAIGLLGRYLATAPDDGRAWFQLGRFYLLDARDWHLQGHRGDPDGLLYLDFAATAFDQATRLSVDSGIVFRGLAELERAVVFLEDSGWSAGGHMRSSSAPPIPPFVLELGANLLGSCPVGGVLLVGSELEALSVWYDNTDLRSRKILAIRPDRYATDSLYRRRMAEAMRTDPQLPIRNALAGVAGRRALCLSPTADSAAAPPLAWTPFRLARVSQPVEAGTDALSVTEFLGAMHQDESVWVQDVRHVYAVAAQYNNLLCSSFLLVFGESPPPACRL
jgi:tetratricopeptide (TPR) repeat protein